jgi:SAM-dependent methyltransferase
MVVQDLVAFQELRPAVSCRICGSLQCADYVRARGYTIVQCADCGLRYVNPQPSEGELARFYAAFDRESSWRGDGEEGFDRKIRDLVLRYCFSGSVLDIGSSRGNFLIAMSAAGFTPFGVEPSKQNSEFARTVNRIPTFTGSIEDFVAAAPRRSFDVVTMLNVLEHLRNPREVLLGLRNLMSEQGIVVVVVPDARLHAAVGEFLRKLGVQDPYLMDRQKHPLVGFDPPQHLCSFEPRTIRLLLERCGFEILLVRHAPAIFNHDKWKNVAKLVLHSWSEILFWMSAGRLLIGYSTLIIGRRLPAQKL